tara:strand:- start:183 stop:392 length:210 start_codon:yes stop_codon:yes gene_type:complete
MPKTCKKIFTNKQNNPNILIKKNNPNRINLEKNPNIKQLPGFTNKLPSLPNPIIDFRLNPIIDFEHLKL